MIKDQSIVSLLSQQQTGAQQHILTAEMAAAAAGHLELLLQLQRVNAFPLRIQKI